MELDSTEKWFIAVCFGALMVAMYSWSRFDEPSYDTGSEFFARYKPRFSTSHARYARAKWGYVFALIVIYLTLSLVPELFNALSPAEPNAGRSHPFEGLPLAVALGLITLQNAPMFKDLERRIRGLLHSLARIPDCVRRSVAQMRGSPFNFSPAAIVAQSRRLGIAVDGTTAPPASLNNLILEDDLLHGWYSIGCVLCALSENNRSKTGIDPLFFDYHKDELDNISSKHAALAECVRVHLTERMRENSSARPGTALDTDDSVALREIRDLRDRLYTFLACGVHSSVKSDAENLEIVRKLGFTISPTEFGQRPLVGPLAGLSFIALVILSVFTGYSTQIFRESVLGQLDPVWAGLFPLPTGTLGIYAWSWSTAAFYFAAIVGALTLRSSRVAKREWFDIDNERRERPILRYIMPTLAGTILGCLTLDFIALIGGPAFMASLSEVTKAIGGALRQSAPWFPLATVMALIAIVLSDSQLKYDGFWRGILGRSICGALVMALAGFLTGQLSVSTVINDFATKNHLAIPSEVNITGTYFSLFIAVQIALFTLVLCIIVQVAELLTARARSLAGACIDVVTRQGSKFRMFFDNAGVASLFDPGEKDPSAASALCTGQWQQFPEGTAVRWHVNTGDSRCEAGDFGLISCYGNSLIYEGFNDRFQGTADFVAQVHLRRNVKNIARRNYRPPRTLARALAA